MEVKVISIETIKPSLPTPDELKTHKLCLFDHLRLTTYFPVVLFYPKNNDNQEITDFLAQLKKSLSETLTIFYPLAGRRKDDFFVDCNDEGVLYFETLVSIKMADFLNPPKMEFLNKLLPCEPNRVHHSWQGLPQILVQVNTFSCGGIAIGLCNLHTLLDACSCSTFLKSWAAICRDSRAEICHTDFSYASTFFPPKDTTGMHSGVLKMISEQVIESKCAMGRYLFKTNVLNDLKVATQVDKSSINPTTRYQALSAFICKHMALACLAESSGSTEQTTAMIHVVDIRRRMGEFFNEKTMGNLIWPTMMLCGNINMKSEIKDLAKIVRENVGKLTKDLFQRMHGDPNFIYSDEFGDLLLEGTEVKNLITFMFTSWSNMGLNEVNFGWGKPLWVGVQGDSQKTAPNMVILIETNEGMEAWVRMEEKHIKNLENDEDFVRFAIINPSV